MMTMMMFNEENDDTCGFAAPATGYRSRTGRQAPVKLHSSAFYVFYYYDDALLFISTVREATSKVGPLDFLCTLMLGTLLH